ncbi:MAG: tetratricopeptide repeat protein [Phycisphaeraceae bacterium]|nr:tetratricopeptide repeat protein [Phycisphaeraceae bacterium]
MSADPDHPSLPRPSRSAPSDERPHAGGTHAARPVGTGAGEGGPGRIDRQAETLAEPAAPRATEATTAHDLPPARLRGHEPPATADGRDPTPGAIGGAAAAAPAVPAEIGGYRIVRVLGEGGMGTVYLAEQASPRRHVALKVIRAGAASRPALRRFALEAEALGRLHHPGIAQIHEAGTFDLGSGEQPYFAMELVEGRSLEAYVADRSLSIRAALLIIARLADAVHHAHIKGVIHRDLKPANVVIVDTAVAGGPAPDPDHLRPKILDFGVARLADAPDGDTLARTVAGQLVGTVPYMSPEQIGGDPHAIDTRTDVYAIGVIAYELLTGRLPHDSTQGSLIDLARTIAESDAPALGRLRRDLRGDVETIVARAMEREPDDRYPSAADLAADIRRYLNDEPIVARPPGRVEQVLRFSRRNRALVGGTMATVLALLAGIIATGAGFAQAVRQRDRVSQQAERLRRAESDATAARDAAMALLESAQREAAKAQAINRFLVRDLLGAADPAVAMGEVVPVELVLAEAARRVDTALADEPELAAFVRLTLGRTLLNLGRFSDALHQFERSRAEASAARGEDSAEVLDAELSIVSALGHLGRPAEAADRLAGLQARADTLIGPESRQALVCRSLRATMLADLGRFDDAEEAYRDVLPRLERALGAADDDTLVARNNLAFLLAGLGRSEEALALFDSVWQESREHSGAMHPRTLSAAGNLAVTLSDLSRYEEAEAIHLEVLEAARHIFGDRHPGVITAMLNVAVVRGHMGRAPEAVPLLRDALAIAESIHGPDHPQTVDTLIELASLERLAGDLPEAIRSGTEAVQRSEAVYGAAHPRTLDALNALAVCHYFAGAPAAAEPVFAAVAQRRAQALGPDHPATLTARHNHAAALLRIGRLDEADAALRDVEALRVALLGDDHPDTSDTRSILAALRTAQGRHDDAASLRLGVAANRERTRGRDHPDTLLTLGELVESLVAAGRPEEAQRFARDLVMRTRSALGEADATTAAAIERLRAIDAMLGE